MTDKHARVLVTGGAGFIGSALVRHLISQTDHVVHNIDKLTYAGSLASLAAVEGQPRYSFLQADISDGPAVAWALADFRPTVITHLAAESHVDRSIDAPTAFINTNIVGTFTLLTETLRYWRGLGPSSASRFRFHHISTDEVFGALEATGSFDESSPYDPRSPYSASKAASDHLVRAWGHTYGLPVIVTNCANNYGPFHFPEKLIPLVIIKCLAGDPLPIYGDGSNVRDWLFVDDHVKALCRVFEAGQPGQTYMIGGRSERTNLQVVEQICDGLDELRPRRDGRSYREQMHFVADRPGHDGRYAVDPSKIERELGWSPAETFETGLRKTIQWYLDHEAWWRPILANTYGGQRLGIAS